MSFQINRMYSKSPAQFTIIKLGHLFQKEKLNTHTNRIRITTKRDYSLLQKRKRRTSFFTPNSISDRPFRTNSIRIIITKQSMNLRWIGTPLETKVISLRRNFLDWMWRWETMEGKVSTYRCWNNSTRWRREISVWSVRRRMIRRNPWKKINFLKGPNSLHRKTFSWIMLCLYRKIHLRNTTRLA